MRPIVLWQLSNKTVYLVLEINKNGTLSLGLKMLLETPKCLLLYWRFL